MFQAQEAHERHARCQFPPHHGTTNRCECLRQGQAAAAPGEAPHGSARRAQAQKEVQGKQEAISVHGVQRKVR